MTRPKTRKSGSPNSRQRAWNALNDQIIACERCPRLVKYCQQIAVEKRKAYLDWDYWGRPVPNFGDPHARLLVVGLAPGAHGANRTGRMFTGDRSGDWLYRALHKAGFANQAESTDLADGLQLIDCAITAACHCAPPQNKPTAAEVKACDDWFRQTIDLMPIKVFVALGQLAWKSIVRHAITQGWHDGKQPKFAHGAHVTLTSRMELLGSYHPSQQNTFTGRLTERMLDDVFRQAREKVGKR